MDAVKFIRERERMCRFYHHAGDCYQCPAKDCECSALEGMVDNDNIVSIVENWSAAHPRKTRQSVFLEQWPDARIYANGALSICPNAVCAWRCGKDGERVEETGTCDDCCREVWMQEVE